MWWTVAKEAATNWSGHRDARQGAALAYYTLFSLAPILIVAIAIAGLAFGPDGTLLACLCARRPDELHDVSIWNAMTGERQMDGGAMMEYFAPLKAWLDVQNKGKPSGW
jgi:cytochrome c1